MKRSLLAAAFVVPMIFLVGAIRAEDKKPPAKSDVVVKEGDRSGKAKVGQSIELQLSNTPPPASADIKVKVDGDAIDKVTEKRAEIVSMGAQESRVWGVRDTPCRQSFRFGPNMA